jgi:hypothetical protein
MGCKLVSLPIASPSSPHRPPNQPTPKPFCVCAARGVSMALVCRRSFPPNADSTCSREVVASRLASGLNISQPPPYTGEYIHEGDVLPKNMSARTSHPDLPVSDCQSPRMQSYPLYGRIPRMSPPTIQELYMAGQSLHHPQAVEVYARGSKEHSFHPL